MELADLWQFAFFRNAIAASLLCGVGCSMIGVFIVCMGIPFIGVAMSHAAMAGAVFALLAGYDPLAGGFSVALACALAVGPLADRSRMNPNISLGVIFSLMMGLAFLGIGLAEEPKNELMGLIWGNILLLYGADVVRMTLVTAATLTLVALFYKEFKAVMFSRALAAASGIRDRLVYYLLLVLCGATVTVNLDTVGGLMLFSLIVNPAAAAWQFTYRLSAMFFLSALFGVASAASGIVLSSVYDLPSGACVVISSSAIFGFALAISPKRRQQGYGQAV
ncbi:MAG TPA: metal ABC transporter permease [Candidatus Glassbacteria bacterium]|nr:metal ABC transporter permease [Candidatus Glassbacteria bacterium]